MSGKNQITGGAFQDFEGNPLANGYLTMQLSHDSQEPVDPGEVVAGYPLRIPLDANGNVAGTVLVWPNDQLTPSGSYYIVNTYRANGTLAGLSQQNYLIPSSPNPFNVGTWVPVGGVGSLTVNVGPDSVQTVSTSGSLGFASATNTLVQATAGVAGITLTLVSAVGVGGQKICVVMVDSGAGGVTVNTTSGQTISGASSLTLTTQWQSYTVESNNANWITVASVA